MALLVVHTEFMDAVTNFVTHLASEFLGFLLCLRLNLFVLKSLLELAGALFSVGGLAAGVVLGGEVSAVVFCGAGGVSGLGVMFLVDR